MMFDLFDFNGDGKTSFEEQMLGTMLIMGAFDAKEDDADADLFDDELDGDEDF